MYDCKCACYSTWRMPPTWLSLGALNGKLATTSKETRPTCLPRARATLRSFSRQIHSAAYQVALSTPPLKLYGWVCVAIGGGDIEEEKMLRKLVSSC